ncbi:MAG: phosphoglucomutase/phosphomannomutase family protein [Chloroflexi bacterium]|nr:phosphoglucomutase/phosphomannomutase family protein [Chloroflexota bacterium]
MAKTPIKFGTDGWRGIIAEDFIFDNVRACAQGMSRYFKEVGLARRGLVVGYDSRFASADFAVATAEVVAANGIQVTLCQGPTPTPVVCHQVCERNAGGAAIITASHNPARWNGFKVKTEHGSAAPDQILADIERHIAVAQDAPIARLSYAEAKAKGLIQEVDPFPSYAVRLAGLVDMEALRQQKITVVADSMFGAGTGYFSRLLAGGALKLEEINSQPNPAFPGINPEPIEPNLARLQDVVRERRAAVGLATDGDADRLGAVTETGQFITQLQTFTLLAYYLLEVRGERGAIVKALTSSRMLNRLGEIYNVPVLETPVGFKHVAPAMLEQDALIGGEESGGYAFRGHVPERDGILAGLYFLDLMRRTGKTPSQLLSLLDEKLGPHRYNRLDLHFPAEGRGAILKRMEIARPKSLDGIPVSKRDTLDGFRFTLEDGAWLLLRFSGTEPLLRIYAEAKSQEKVDRLLSLGREMAGV